ncbi:MAG: hypothetical protein AAFX04_11425 [Pseudomonadota bacterium]
MQWLKVDGGADAMVAAVNYDPGVCLSNGASLLAKEGALLFRNPTLLGGQASKARLSCASCHVNGGDNPHFHFPGASGASGTADVSNSFFSAAGGNGIFDPVAIPDLSQPGKVSRSEPGEMEAFLKTLIVTEFAGAEPDSRTLRALAEYIRALKSCNDLTSAESRMQHGLTADLMLVEMAAAQAELRIQTGDSEKAQLMVAGARDILGLVHERFAGDDLAEMRASIEQASITLKAAAQEAAEGRRSVAFYLWRQRFADLRRRLEQREGRSLYDRERLRAALD